MLEGQYDRCQWQKLIGKNARYLANSSFPRVLLEVCTINVLLEISKKQIDTKKHLLFAQEHVDSHGIGETGTKICVMP